VIPSGGTTGLHDIFALQAERTPDAIALISDGTRVPYAELDARANGLAAHLVTAGVRPGDVVGVCLGRDVPLVVTVIAVLKAAAGFTILDPRLPARRVTDVCARAGVATIVAEPGEDRFPGLRLVEPDQPQRATPPVIKVSDADIACVMFTSGSTGQPKGVVAPHRAVLATLTGQDFVSFSAGQVWLQCSPLSWDAFALELFGPLLHGATCVLQPGPAPEPALIADLIARHGVSTVYLSASLLNFMLDEYPGAFAGVRQVMTGGEAASVAHVRRLLAAYPGIRLVNGYSPVENMIFTLCHTVTEADTARPAIPVGRPLYGKQVRVLSQDLSLVPDGTPGEIYMAGPGMAHGGAVRRRPIRHAGRTDVPHRRSRPDRPRWGLAAARPRR
jgi:non-ribosomal peptide synthetase component F